MYNIAAIGGKFINFVHITIGRKYAIFMIGLWVDAPGFFTNLYKLDQ